MRNFILLLAFALAACTGAPPLEEPEPIDPLDKAVKYYMSEERHEQFDELLDHLETSVGHAMVEQRIPSVIDPYGPASPFGAPDWITLQTQPRKGWHYMSFTTRRDANDKADIRNSQGFGVHKCGSDFSFRTESYLPASGTEKTARVVSSGPYSYWWTSLIEKRAQPDERTSLNIKFRGGDTPPADQPLQKQWSLYEIQDGTNRRVTVDEIKNMDMTFINDVRGLDLSNSKCAESH